MKENLGRWRPALGRRGTKVSRSQTAVLCADERNPSGTVGLHGAEMKKVEDLKHSGSTVLSNGECGRRGEGARWRKMSGVMKEFQQEWKRCLV